MNRALPDVAAAGGGPGAGNGDGSFSAAGVRAAPVYQFEDVEVIASQGCVRRGGAEHGLRQQAFQVLVYLLENRDRLVSKQELMDRFWQDTAVTDNALVQCVAEIRRAIGDDSRQPRFVRTIPKVGYRFIAPAKKLHTIPLLVGQTDRARSVRESALAEPEAPRRIRWLPLALACAAVVLIAVGALVLRRSEARQEFALERVPGRKAIAVMYFENQSPRRDLNWLREGLADMFITDLARSDKLTVLSRQQLHVLLARIGRNSTDQVRPADALEIARRSRAESLVEGSFMVFGDDIVINIQLHDAATGQLLTADRIVAMRPDDILGQVDRVSLKLASRLGAGPSQAGGRNNLAEAMTNNLEAYRYYSLGVTRAQAFENADAIALLAKAVELDPKFAMAWARIGYAYSVTDFLPEKGRPYLEKAFELSDHLTPKDRLYTEAWYAISREDFPGAIRIFRRITDDYPLETEAFNNLGLLLQGEERTDEAIAVLRQGLAADPEAKELYNALGMCFSSRDRTDDAIAADQRYVELVPKEPNAHDSLGMSYQRGGRYEDALAEYRAALSLDPNFEPAIIHLGDVYAQQGRYRDAVREYLRYVNVTHSDAARAVGYGSIAQVCWRSSNLRQGEEAAHNEMRYQKGAVWNSLLYALERGDSAGAASLRDQLFRDLPYPVRGVRHEQRSYNYFRGTLALRDGNKAEAIADFREALRHLPPSSGLDSYDDCLGNAWLALGNADAAIAEYQRILRVNPNYPLAHFHLAKAYNQKHQPEQALAEYRRFLEVWRHADADVPEVVEAKERIAGR